MNKLQTYGFRTSLILVYLRLRDFTQAIYPRTYWGDHLGLRSMHSVLSAMEIEKLYKWARDEEMLMWSGGIPVEMTYAEYKSQICRLRWQYRSNQIILFIMTRADELIGKVGLYWIDWQKLEGDFGIIIDKRYWGQHYGRDATRIFQRYIFTQTPINRIYLGTFKENIRAQRSFAAAGFKTIGITKRYLPSQRKEVEGVEMEITRTEFNRKNA